MVFAPKAVVEGPARAGLPFGLFSTFTIREGAQDRWENGVEWESLTCEPAGIYLADCAPPEEKAPKEFNGGPALGEADAFTVLGTYKCSPTGHPVAFAQEQAEANLRAREQQAVESRLWQGLTDGADALSGTGVADALGAAEEWLGDVYGSLGVIHVGRRLAPVLAGKGLVRVSGNRMTTVLGTPVSVGSGYPGGGFIGVTPALVGYRSEVFAGTSQSGDLLDRDTNDLYGIAERSYVIGWDPCGTAVVTVTAYDEPLMAVPGPDTYPSEELYPKAGDE